ncbi:MAG: molybdopterin molybdotransferase MoeA [Gracilibacteraceae bacterium]|jgi:molybdopterin molybdotransferase|nr:molybdopterin molybdotransferase MoeA [Gracilibacteraceae bacterium]
MQKNITLENALALLLERCPILPPETVPVGDAFGRVLAADFFAAANVPPFTRSPYDGYAMRAADIAAAAPQAPVRLEVTEEIPAGRVPGYPLRAGQAAKVLTGAPLPAGADCVEKYELLERAGSLVSVFAPLRAGQNVVPVGEDIHRGQLLAPQGFVINGALMGLLAAMGEPGVQARRRPRAAVLSTGDELLDLGEPLAPGKIRNSNLYALGGYIKATGAEPVLAGIARDRTEEVAARLDEALNRADLVFTTGGVSVGDYDVVADAVRAAGAELLFHRLALKPGAPSLAAVRDGRLIIGLSGNPAAALLIFLLLGVPVLKKMSGRAEVTYPVTEAVLQREFRKSSSERRFLRGRLLLRDGGVQFEPAAEQNNDAMTSLLRCDALAEIPANSGPLAVGARVKVWLLDNCYAGGLP